MTKIKKLENEIEILQHQNQLLKLKLEQEEVSHSLYRYRLEVKIAKLEEECKKLNERTPIGFIPEK